MWNTTSESGSAGGSAGGFTAAGIGAGFGSTLTGGRTAFASFTPFPFADPGETKKRSPEDDDDAGVCDVYPTADHVGACFAEIDGGSFVCVEPGARRPSSTMPM